MHAEYEEMLRLSQLLRQTLDDEESFNTAMSTVLQANCAKSPVPASIEDSVTRMIKYKEKAQQRVELLRKQKIDAELSEIKGRPQINQNSRRHSHVPIHQRAEALLKARNDHLENLRVEAEQKKKAEEDALCTFSPLTNRKTPRPFLHRTNKPREEPAEPPVQGKPSILERSKKLADKRCSRPVVDRLHVKTRPPAEVQPTSPFRPILNKNSVKLSSNRSSNVFNRLYGLSSTPDLPERSPRPSMLGEASYTINTSRGPVSSQPVNEVSYTPSLAGLFTSLTKR